MITSSINFLGPTPSPGQGYITALKQGTPATASLVVLAYALPQKLFIGESDSLSTYELLFASGLSLQKIHNPSSPDRTFNLFSLEFSQELSNVFGHEVSLSLPLPEVSSDRTLLSGVEGVVQLLPFGIYSTDSYLYFTKGISGIDFTVLHTSGEDINLIRGQLSSLEVSVPTPYTIGRMTGEEASLRLRQIIASTSVIKGRERTINSKTFLVLKTPSWQERREELYEFEQKRTEDLKFFLSLLEPRDNP